MKRKRMLSSPLRDHSALLQLGLNRVQFVEQLLLVALDLTKATCYTLSRQRELSWRSKSIQGCFQPCCAWCWVAEQHHVDMQHGHLDSVRLQNTHAGSRRHSIGSDFATSTPHVLATSPPLSLGLSWKRNWFLSKSNVPLVNNWTVG